MLVREVVRGLRPRAQNLGLVDAHTGYVNEQSLRYYLLRAMRDLATHYQLDMFTSMNRTLVTLSSDVESYDIPLNFRGWWSPDDERTSGLSVAETDGTDPLNLRYRDPARYHLERTTDTDKPSIFTVSENMLWFSPIPDAAYIIQGVHKTALEATDEVPDMYLPAVEAQALQTMAADKGKLTPTLEREYVMSMTRLCNNEARLHQKFKQRQDQRFGQRSRRYGTGGW